MKKKLTFLCCLFLLCTNPVQAAQMLDRIVAVVNGEIVTYQDLMQQTRLMAGDAPDQAEHIAPQVLQAMIDDIILRQEAARLKVDVSDSELDNELRQLKARRRLSEDEFKRSLQLQGMTEAQFRDRTRQEIVKHKMLGYMVRRKVVITQEEINAYLEKNRTELSTDHSLDLQLVALADQAQAQALYAKITGGELSLTDAVREYSVGPKVDDGILRDVHWRELDTPWRDALRSKEPDQICAPFLVQERWVILKLLARRDGERQDKSVMEEEVREALMRPKLEERFKEYMTGLRSRAIIEVRL